MEPASDFRLDNGMRFIVAPDGAAPVAALGIWVRAGVCEEPPERRGIAHFLEHMMFRGSARFGPKEHTARVAAVGGECNAFTGFDETVFHETGPSASLELVFELEADRFQRLALDAAAVDVEKKVVIEELRAYENQPMARAFRRLLGAVGGGHPYGLDPLGRQEHLEACARGDLLDFWHRLYRPENAFAVAAGDVEPGTVRELAERHFGAWRVPEARPGPPEPGRFLPAVGRRTERLSLEVPLAVRMHRLPPPEELDRPALDLLVALLSDGESAPVQEELVRRRRLCVHAGAHSFALRRGGALAFFGAFLPPGRHAARREAIRGVCERLAAEGPDPAAFARVLRRARRDRAEEDYSAHERMLGLGSAQMLEGSYRSYERSLEDLAAVTPARLGALAGRLFAAENTLELDVVPEHSPWWMPLAGLAMRLVRR
jgi:zinc protease